MTKSFGITKTGNFRADLKPLENSRAASDGIPVSGTGCKWLEREGFEVERIEGQAQVAPLPTDTFRTVVPDSYGWMMR